MQEDPTVFIYPAQSCNSYTAYVLREYYYGIDPDWSRTIMNFRSHE